MPEVNQVAEAAAAEVQVAEATKTETTQPTLEQLQEQLKAVQAELSTKEELLHKVRKFEKENKEAAALAQQQLAEQGKFKELYEAEASKSAEWQKRYTDTVVGSALNAELQAAGVISVATAAKLIDKSKVEIGDDGVNTASIKSLIAELKASDPALFVSETKPVPPAVKAGEGDPVGGFEKEIRAATTQKQIEAIMRKYGKL